MNSDTEPDAESDDSDTKPGCDSGADRNVESGAGWSDSDIESITELVSEAPESAPGSTLQSGPDSGWATSREM